MRIAFISPTSGLGGGEMMMLTLATWCRDVGHSVLVMGPSDGEQWLLQEAQQRGLDTFGFVRKSPIDFNCLRDLVRELRSHRIDIVHGHMFTGAYYGVAAARWLGIPSVVTFHGGAEQTDVLRRRLVIRWAIRNSDFATLVSEQMRLDLVKALGSKYASLDVIPNGMPVYPGDRSSLRSELQLRPDEKLVTAIGSCCERKNHVSLVRALAGLPSEVPWRLAICGREDDATSTIVDAIETYGVKERVHLLGIRRDVGDVLAATDIFAMPSLWEGTPLALVEAMLVGKACVASTAGGMPEMIDDGVHGLLVEATDITALGSALGTLIRDADGVAERLGSAAKKRAAAVYGLEQMCQQYKAIFDALMARRAAA